MTEAVGILSSGQRVDAIFSDVDLPGCEDGLSLAIWVHSRRLGIPIILTSGVRAIMPTLATESGIPLVPKPYDVEQVTALIARLIAAGAPSPDRSPFVSRRPPERAAHKAMRTSILSSFRPDSRRMRWNTPAPGWAPQRPNALKRTHGRRPLLDPQMPSTPPVH